MLSLEQIKQAIKAAAPQIDVERLPLDLALRDAGMDSLEYYNVIVELQTISNTEIPDEDVDALTTIRQIQLYFEKKE